MAQSSAVWWSSITTSPRAVRVRSNPACLASESIMWSRKPILVSTRVSPDPSTTSLSSIAVSLVSRLISDVLGIEHLDDSGGGVEHHCGCGQVTPGAVRVGVGGDDPDGKDACGPRRRQIVHRVAEHPRPRHAETLQCEPH